MALDTVISDEYKAAFIDHSYSPTTQWMLQGLAAVIEDETDDWRPTMTELIELIPHDQSGKRLIKAGYAYGAGKQLRSGFPAPAILLFCSALHVVGDVPNTELKGSIARAEEIIRAASLNEDESVKAVIRAAHERACFDKVTQMLRGEFRDGLRRTGRYSDEALDRIVKDIVNHGNAARHEALIDVIDWSTTSVTDFMVMSVSSIPEGQEFWESFLIRTDKESTFFGTGRLGTLAAQAEKGN
jgi:hypothetical protein